MNRNAPSRIASVARHRRPYCLLLALDLGWVLLLLASIVVMVKEGPMVTNAFGSTLVDTTVRILTRSRRCKIGLLLEEARRQ